MTAHTEREHCPPSDRGARWAVMVAALGVVYGDIGTSPLYAIKECFSPESLHHVAPTPANVLGVLSLVLWSLTMVMFGFLSRNAFPITAYFCLPPNRVVELGMQVDL